MRSTVDSPPASASSSCSDPAAARFRPLAQAAYAPTLTAMQAFTDARTPATADEIWMVEHPPVFTLGLNAAREHLLAPGDIPVVQTDRGGQVTYHGPGQLVAYTLIDLRRAGLNVRQLVSALEQAVVATLGEFGIEGYARADAPGVYVAGAKVASLGLRIRRGCSYHGLALNVAMNLEPFGRINPCGHESLAVTQLKDLGGPVELGEVAGALGPRLLSHLASSRSDGRSVSRS